MQALFLDRGLRDHTLMQAIARTNRRYPGKNYGLVLDYWGTFDNLRAALEEFASDDLVGLVEDTDALIGRFPEMLDAALAVVADAPAGSARRRMLWVVRHFTDNPEEAERFEELVQDAQGAWETLSPDPRLLPYKQRYGELLEVWLAWRRGTAQRPSPGGPSCCDGRPSNSCRRPSASTACTRTCRRTTIDADFLRRPATGRGPDPRREGDGHRRRAHARDQSSWRGRPPREGARRAARAPAGRSASAKRR